MIDLSQFDIWPTHADVSDPTTWSSQLMLDVLGALLPENQNQMNELEALIIELFARNFVETVVKDRAERLIGDEAAKLDDAIGRILAEGAE